MVFSCISAKLEDCFRIILVCVSSISICFSGLLVKWSQVDGVILYNTFSAVFFAELIKLAIGGASKMYESARQQQKLHQLHRKKSQEKDDHDYCDMERTESDLPRESSSIDLKRYRNQKALVDEEAQHHPPFPTWKHIFLYSIPGLLYVVVNNVHFAIYEHLNPGVISVCWNAKVIFVALLLKFVLGRTISSRQWIGIALMIVGAAATEISQILWKNIDLSISIEEEGASDEWEERSKNNVNFQNEVEGFLLLGIGMLIAACANVFIEYLFKQEDQAQVPFHEQNIILYSWGVAFNGGLWLVQASKLTSTGRGGGGIFDHYTYWTIAVIIVHGIMGYLHGAMFKYLDAIAVVFSGAIAMLATAIMSAIFFELHINYIFCLGFALVLVSIYIYFVEKSQIVCHQDTTMLPSSSSEDDEDLVIVSLCNCSAEKKTNLLISEIESDGGIQQEIRLT